jgi:hypothetical protein
MRNDTRTAVREIGVELLHAAPDLVGGDDAALLQQLLHGAAHDLVFRRRPVIEAAVVRMVVMLHAGSSQCS